VKPIWITSEQFYGVPYIWCMLHNFAGNVEMYGILDSIASGPVDAHKSETQRWQVCPLWFCSFLQDIINLLVNVTYQKKKKKKLLVNVISHNGLQPHHAHLVNFHVSLLWLHLISAATK
jgi:hypothetical protein